jgi:hypothetical protein
MSGFIFFKEVGCGGSATVLFKKGVAKRVLACGHREGEKKKNKVGPGLAGYGNCGARWATVCQLVDLSSVLTTAYYYCTTVPSLLLIGFLFIVVVSFTAVCLFDSYLVLWRTRFLPQ